MTSAYRNSASAALSAARPLAARLDAARDPEDLAADLIDIWGAVETALRALLGGSALSGGALVREARLKEHLALNVTHDLLSFAQLRDRIAGGGRIDASELSIASKAFFGLDSSLLTESSKAPAAPGVGGEIPAAAAAPTAEQPAPIIGVHTQKKQRLIMLAVAALVILVAGVAAYLLFGRGSSALSDGARLYAGGQRAQARAAFEQAARQSPKRALPHVYLGRMAREDRDFITAQKELELAVRLEPGSALAQREMGSYLYAMGQFDLASRFYTRAVQANPDDKLALGYLACSYARMGQMENAARFMQHAGPGEWSTCMQPRVTG